MTMADVTELDATAVVHQLLPAPGSGSTTRGSPSSNGSVISVAIYSSRYGTTRVTFRSAPVRRIRETSRRTCGTHSSTPRRWPDRFLEHVLSNPALHDDIEILDALGEVDRPAARALLVAAVNQRRPATPSAASTPSDR